MAKVKARKYLTCSACRKYVAFQGDALLCNKCGTKYDFDSDTSTWKGNVWVNGGEWSSAPKTAPKEGGKGGGKGSGKGSTDSGLSEGPYAKGCTLLLEKEATEFGLTAHDIPLFIHFETLGSDEMEEMAALPRFNIYKPAWERLAMRKFPPRDTESDLDWQLGRAKKQVTRFEKTLATAAAAREEAQTALNTAVEAERKISNELEEAKAERDKLSLKVGEEVARRSGATMAVPAPVVVEVALPVVLERQLAIHKAQLDAAADTRKKSVTQLTTVEAQLKTLKEQIPADDDEEGTEPRRGRSRDRISDLKRQLAEAETRRTNLTTSIDKCDATATSIGPLFEKLSADAKQFNDSLALLTAEADRIGGDL